MTCDKQYLVEVGVSAWCPTRKTNLGRKPRITAHANRDSKSSRFEIWIQAARQPQTTRNKKVMVAEGIKVALKNVMRNHLYIFGETKKKLKKKTNLISRFDCIYPEQAKD